jgi:hypothetical protein
MTRRLAVACVGFVLALAEMAVAERPWADWRTIETAHFRVHFPASYSAWAERAAAALEGAHGPVTEYVGFSPPGRIDVVVRDPQADSNGFAFPFLDRPAIELWTTPPDPESGLGDFRDWTEILVTHEFAHIVHLTRPRNRPGLFERLLPLPVGPVLRISPRWVAEGYATVVEGALTGSGRPSSSYRAMVLRRFAIEGKLPAYGALDGTSGWLGGSMAYLVGSSYLEWLEAHEEPGSLTRLWKRMASKRGGSFSAAFHAVFGRSPSDMYDRFRAEITARALEQEHQLSAAGLVAGEKWQRLEGATASLEVSPDGTRLLAVRSPRRGERLLAVWTLSPSSEEKSAAARREDADRRLSSDPNEIVDKREQPEPRSPRWTLPRANGHSPEDPRWMPDGRSVLFTRREPGPNGDLHRDLFRWTPETGEVARLTFLADVSDADPSPDGTWAVAVRDRYGFSELVRVDLPGGRVSGLFRPPGSDPSEIVRHPRLSPDGSQIAALLHRSGRWRLVVLPAREPAGAAREVSSDAGVFGAPAWSPGGERIYAATDSSGTWDLAAFRLDAAAPPVRLTRVTGGAFSPAPAPDGAGLFFLELTGKGVDVGRLFLAPDPWSAPLPDDRLPSVLPPPSVPPRPLSLAPVGISHPYRALETHVIRLFSAFTAGPDGASEQIGVEGTDVVGRLDWIAAAAFGNAAGPRGGTVALAWSGFPVVLRAQLFSALERPGAQRLVSRPDLDEDRRGGAMTASWETARPWGRMLAEAFGGATRIEALADSGTFSRFLAGARGTLDWRRSRGRNGVAFSAEAGGEAGRTDGFSWQAEWGGLRGRATVSDITASLAGRIGRISGAPTAFDLFAIGGAPSAVIPPALDFNRVDSPALPAAAQTGERLEGLRAELSGSGSPLVLYAERWRAWSSGAAKPEPIRVEGIELRLERVIPLDLPESLTLYLGIARARSVAPRFDSVRGYAGLVYRP